MASNEIWKDVPNYEERYQVSNFGRLKSKQYLKKGNRNSFYYTKEKILINTKNNHGYYFFKLSNGSKYKTYKIHQLVAMAFLGHTPNGHSSIVDHIDRDKLNNRLDNLRIVTPKESVKNRNVNKTSKYSGVSFDKSRNKWVARININGVYKFLGRFESETKAYNKVKEYE